MLGGFKVKKTEIKLITHPKQKIQAEPSQQEGS
jgi:hypothetical protein